MRVLLSAFFWTYLVGSLVVFWFAVVPVWLIVTPFDRLRRFSHWYATTWASQCIAISPFWRVRVSGRDRIPNRGAFVLAANHLSAADIMVLFRVRKHFKWVAKESLFRLPFLGWMMSMAGYVPIKRGSAESRHEMFRACHRHLRRGSSVMIFPEGTRSRDGEIQEFRMGAFKLAVDADVPVVPIVVEGTLEVLPVKTWVFQHERIIDVSVRVLDPVAPAEVDYDPERLRDEVRARICADYRGVG